jgi:N-acetylneuraminic acid mutarotase
MKKVINIFNLIILCIILGFAIACSKTDTTPPITPPVTPTIKPIIPDGWKALTEFQGGGNVAGTTLTIGDKIYSGLGYNAISGYSSVSNGWFEYDPVTNKWTQKAGFPGAARANAVGFSIGGKAYVGLGTNYDRTSKQDLYNDFYEYDPIANTWTKKGDFSMPRDQPIYFVIGDKGYMGTGNNPPNSPTNTTDFWEYDPKMDKWTMKADFPGAARCRSFSFVINGKGYVGGGENNSISKQNDFYEYDPVKNEWTSKTSFTDKLARSRGFSIGNFGYMIGGLVGTVGAESPSNKVIQYNPTTNTWTVVSSMASDDDSKLGRFYTIIATIQGKAYIGGGGYGDGGNPSNKKDFYEFTPK